MHKPLKLYHHMTFGNRENMVSYFLTVFENHRKSIIQHCERSELRLHFEWTKVNQKFQKIVNLSNFQTLWCTMSHHLMSGNATLFLLRDPG